MASKPPAVIVPLPAASVKGPDMVQRLIALFLLIVLTPFALLLMVIIGTSLDSAPALAVEVGGYVRQAADLALLCGRVVFALGAAGGLVFVARMVWKPFYEHNQPRDGSHRLRTYKVTDPATGKKVSILVNPDLMVAPALAVGDHGVRELGSYGPEIYSAQAAKRALVAEWQARTPGDAAISSKFGSLFRPPASRPALPARPLLPAPRIVGGETPPAPAQDAQPAAQPMGLLDALRAGSAERFVLGQADDGRLAVWQPREHLSLGVFGVSGTGKTRSTGFETVLLAARAGYHVVVLDPKGGADFGPFRSHVEWQPTDSYTFADQMAALHAVHVARHRLMAEQEIGEWRELGGQAGPEIVVVLEEFGALRQEIGMASGGARRLQGVDSMMEAMFRLSRATGFHFVVIDQAPENLHPVVRGGCKLRLAYQLDISSASVLKEYEATSLDPVGAFMVDRRPYRSWDCSAKLPALLRQLPAFGHERLLPAPNGAERLSPEGANAPNGGERAEREGANGAIPPPPEPPFDVRSAPKREVVWWWRDRNPNGSQAEFRTWLADRGGQIARGYISDAFALWSQERAAAVRDGVSLDELRAQGVPVAFQGRRGAIGWDEKE